MMVCGLPINRHAGGLNLSPYMAGTGTILHDLQPHHIPIVAGSTYSQAKGS